MEGQTIYVASGEVIIGIKNDWLISTPLGSCVAVVAYDAVSKTGGMAHVLLPGKSISLRSSENRLRYAADAIEHLLAVLLNKGAAFENIAVCLVGGANVLRKKNDSIALEVANSVLGIIMRKQMVVHAVALGGYERYTVSLNLDTGIVYYTIGDSSEMMLCNFEMEAIIRRDKFW